MRKDITRELLEHEFLVLRKPTEQIGREVGLSGRAIRYRLTQYGLGDILAERARTASIGKPPTNKGKPGQPPHNKGMHTASGRRYVHDKERGNGVAYARYLMEQHLGRRLRRDEIVHHKDGDSTHDVLENLEVISQSVHIKHHNPVLARWAKRRQ